jgi:hypothetical protein
VPRRSNGQKAGKTKPPYSPPQSNHEREPEPYPRHPTPIGVGEPDRLSLGRIPDEKALDEIERIQNEKT